MNNPHKPYRMILTFAGGKYDLRIQAHETDNTLLVIKSPNPEALDNLIAATGIDPGVKERIKGSTYHIAFCSKEQTSKLLASAICNLATKEEAALTMLNEAGAAMDPEDIN